MSKSLGNILDPIELIDEFGADAVRFTLAAMAAMGRDLKLSRDRIAGYRNFGTKLWNAARFAEMNDCRPDPAFDPQAVDPHRQPVDRRRDRPPARDPRRRARRLPLQRRRRRALRPRLGQGLRLVRRAGQAALRRRRRRRDPRDDGLGARPVPDPACTRSCPSSPRRSGARPPSAEAALPRRLAGLRRRAVDPAADAEMNWVIGLIEEIRSVRAQMHVPAGARVTLVTLALAPARPRRSTRNRALVARLARVERFESRRRGAEGRRHPDRAGRELLPAARRRHRHRRRARPAGQGARQARQGGGRPPRQARQPRLRRPAPEEVVDEQRARLEAAEEEIAILRAAAARLASL